MGQPAITVKWSQITDNKLYPKAILIGLVSYALTTLMTYLGIASRALVETGRMAPITNIDGLVMTFIQTFYSPWVVGLVVAAALSAIMSTGAAHLIACSSACVNDIMANWLHMDMSGKKGRYWGQFATLLCLILSLAMSFRPDLGIQQLGNAAWGTFAAVITPALALGLRWRRATKQGVWASGIFGLAVIVVVNVLKYADIWYWPFTLIMEAFVMIACFIIMVVVSLMTKVQDKSHFMPESLEELAAKKAALSVNKI
jgi:sodium/proline symporter